MEEETRSMVILTCPGTTDEQLDEIRERVEALGARTHLARHGTRAVIGCAGAESAHDQISALRLPGVAAVVPSRKPYRLAAREFAGDPSVVPLGGGATAGGRELLVVAGPCAVESHEMLEEAARAVRDAGAHALRGGAFKPRTSPYSYRGPGGEGLEALAAVRAACGLPVVSEVMDVREVERIAEHVDVLQVGARSMQNFPLLTEVGRVRRPVLLKRGMSATLEELLLAAEYVMVEGNADVILCERGIRTFERSTRNTLDISAVPILKAETHLPVIVDPSHAAGRRELVAPLAYAAIAAGADGIMAEVHPWPAEALCDREQALSPADFRTLMEGLARFAAAAGRTLNRSAKRWGDVA